VGLFAVQLMGIGVITPSTTVSAVSACVVPAAATTTDCPAGAPLTPAAQAGFQAGDKIVAFQGRPFATDDWTGLQNTIRAASGTVTVTVERGGQLLDLHPTLITTDLPSLVENPDDPNSPPPIVKGSFLGLSPVQFYEKQSVGAVGAQIGDVVARTGKAIVQLPQRVPALFGAVFLGEKRDLNGPVGIVGVSRIGGQILALEAPPIAELSVFLNLLALVNISLFLFNLLPIPPLDGGQIFPAIWESVRRRIARLRGRPDPGPVDVARLMPVAYVVAMVFIAWSGLLFVADIINPVTLPG
jgi:membrane-associated protease RseP (regulator of RpoE activity)